jgi:cytoskeletal protein CcmA (bactofilin family)
MEQETPSIVESEEILKEKSMSEEKDVISINAVEEKGESVTESASEMNFNVEEADAETTYITKGTKIKGDLETDGSVDIIGKVEGNVICQGKLVVGGEVLGGITAGEIYANNAKIEGDVKSYGSVKVGVGSMIIGGIEGESAVIAGAVNGDIDVKGPVIVDSTAVIMGNIKSRSVQINNGAVIEGFCSQSYSDIDVKSFFA